MARTSSAAMAYREALLGGLEKILEKNHRRLVLEMQQWLGEHQAMNSSEIHEEAEKPEREKRDSAGSDSRKEKVSTCSESLPFSLTASQVALISPSRVSSMERSGYHVAKQVSVPSFAAPSVAASEAEPRLCERRWRLLEKAVSSWQFEAFFAFVIATNSLFIGLSIEWEAQERTFTLPTELFVIQITYTLLFLAEVCLKLLAFGARDFFCSSGWAWNCFDLAIVMSAVFECTVEFVAHDPHLSAGSSSNLRILRILRMTRLTRIFRVIRVVRFFRSLRTLVFSIVNTLKSLFWAMLLLAMIMYVFGILFTDISNNHIIESGTPEAESIIKLEKYFGTLHDSVHTLFMSISGGLTWMDATMALAAVSWVWKYVFSCYIAFSVFAVLNVMTGVFCQSAIKGAERDQEMVVQSLIMDKHQLKTSLEKLFQKMDDEKSGKLSLANFEKHFQDEEVRVLFEALDIGVTDAWTLFLSLDHNEDYQIEAEEFLEGCLQLRGAAKAIDLFMLRRQVAKLMLVLSEPEETLREKTACLEVETCM